MPNQLCSLYKLFPIHFHIPGTGRWVTGWRWPQLLPSRPVGRWHACQTRGKWRTVQAWRSRMSWHYTIVESHRHLWCHSCRRMAQIAGVCSRRSLPHTTYSETEALVWCHWLGLHCLHIIITPKTIKGCIACWYWNWKDDVKTATFLRPLRGQSADQESFDLA